MPDSCRLRPGQFPQSIGRSIGAGTNVTPASQASLASGQAASPATQSSTPTPVAATATQPPVPTLTATLPDMPGLSFPVQAMIASNAKFQIITTFNEWGEGTAVESASEWTSPSGNG